MKKYRWFLLTTGSAFAYQAHLRSEKGWRSGYHQAAVLARVIASLPKEQL